MRRSSGVTLLELMIAVTILAIVSSLAVPGFGNLLRDTERTTAVNNFVHALYLARSEAVKRGAIVSLCKSPDGATCANRTPEWSSGWIVFENADRDEPPQRDSDDPLLAVYKGWSTGRITSNRNAYSFRPYAQGVVNGTLLFCDARGSTQARAIIVSHTGRPRVAKRDSSNQPLRCP